MSGGARSLATAHRRPSMEDDEDDDEDEKDDAGPLTKLKGSNSFEYIVVGVIILNTLTMALQANWPKQDFWPILEHAFLVFFVLELCLRLYVDRCGFLWTNADEQEKLKEKRKDSWSDPENHASKSQVNHWGVFDLFVVCCGVLDQWVVRAYLSFYDRKHSPGAGAMLTVLRMLRLFRLLRMVRLIKRYRQLVLLVYGFGLSLQSVLWVAGLMFVLVLAFGLIATTMFGHDCANFQPEARDNVCEHWSTLGLSMSTLFQFISFDDWSSIARAVMTDSSAYMLFFLAYLWMASFTMLSVLTGLICDKINSTTDSDEERVLKNIHDENVRDEDRMAELFNVCMSNGERRDIKLLENEQLDFPAFLTVMCAEGAELLAKLDIDFSLKEINEIIEPDTNHPKKVKIQSLFDILTGGDGSSHSVAHRRMTYWEFADALRRLQGAGTSKEMLRIQLGLQRAMIKVKELKPSPGAEAYRDKTEDWRRKLQGMNSKVQQMLKDMDYMEKKCKRLKDFS